jgi:hypothetical protein
MVCRPLVGVGREGEGRFDGTLARRVSEEESPGPVLQGLPNQGVPGRAQRAGGSAQRFWFRRHTAVHESEEDSAIRDDEVALGPGDIEIQPGEKRSR